ncbi:hypothetical protein LWI28_022276 [Acer negundo]|uniref:RNase H type-1 domain-containing protein n=1 Tax=Acer negundo TaxID=4023 RepID=A0AAD5NY64_ACENE|nr:hypothetical protein LWI28_022276 [Acer negundo]
MTPTRFPSIIVAPDRTWDRRKIVRVAWEKLVRWSRSWRSKAKTDILERTKKEIIIAGDSKTAVSWVNKIGEIGSFKHVQIIYDLRNFMKVLICTLVVFHNRSTNSIADNLAKRGSNQNGDKLNWSLE